MSEVLLIFELIPEKTSFYRIPINVISEQQMQTLASADGKVINIHEDTDDVNEIYELISDPEDTEDSSNPINGTWLQYQVELPLIGPFERAYWMAFGL